MMKIFLAFAPLFLSTLVTSKSFLFASNQLAIVDNELSVPGSNPLEFCSDPSNFILTIDNVDLDPNPPEK